MSMQSGNRSFHESKAEDDVHSDKNLQEWRILARVLDRLFFIIYMIIFPIVTIVYFGILVNQH